MTGWEDVPVVERPSDEPNDDVIELDDSGWGQLVGWAVGVSRLRRALDRREHMTTIVYPASGRTVRRPRSAAEQAEIEDDVNSYLAEAGVPPRPAGYVWYVLKPPTVASKAEFWARINQAQSVSVRPERLISVLPAIVDDLYPNGWPGDPGA